MKVIKLKMHACSSETLGVHVHLSLLVGEYSSPPLGARCEGVCDKKLSQVTNCSLQWGCQGTHG